LSSFDRLCIVNQYNTVLKKKGSTATLNDRGYTEQQLKFLRKNLGSTMIHSAGIEITGDRSLIPDYNHFGFIITVFYSYQRSGQLPFSGGSAEQPAQIMEIFELLSELDAEREVDNLKEQEKKRNVRR
jgi:hypothetical protein